MPRNLNITAGARKHPHLADGQIRPGILIDGQNQTGYLSEPWSGRKVAQESEQHGRGKEAHELIDGQAGPVILTEGQNQTGYLGEPWLGRNVAPESGSEPSRAESMPKERGHHSGR